MYVPSKVIGNGSFGVVFQAHHRDTHEVVAIKKVLQDRRFKVRGGPTLPTPLLTPVSQSQQSSSCPSSADGWPVFHQNRELQIMRSLDHPNVLSLKTCYYTNGDKVRTVHA